VRHAGRPCRRWASWPAITSDDTPITYEGLGTNRGDRVLCQLRNGPELVIAIAAAWMRGAVHVGADNDLTGPELSPLVERLEARALVFQPPQDRAGDRAALGEAAGTSGAAHLIVHGADPDDHHSLAELLAPGGAVSADLPGPLIPRSCSSPPGRPESQGGRRDNVGALGEGGVLRPRLPPGIRRVHLLFLPIGHVFGSRLALMALRGGHLVLADRFSPTGLSRSCSAKE
jgi:hypothetical protein